MKLNNRQSDKKPISRHLHKRRFSIYKRDAMQHAASTPSGQDFRFCGRSHGEVPFRGQDSRLFNRSHGASAEMMNRCPSSPGLQPPDCVRAIAQTIISTTKAAFRVRAIAGTRFLTAKRPLGMRAIAESNNRSIYRSPLSRHTLERRIPYTRSFRQ